VAAAAALSKAEMPGLMCLTAPVCVVKVMELKA
jgi:hypothetical protein